jgi:hypothetical protein
MSSKESGRGGRPELTAMIPDLRLCTTRVCATCSAHSTLEQRLGVTDRVTRALLKVLASPYARAHTHTQNHTRSHTHTHTHTRSHTHTTARVLLPSRHTAQAEPAEAIDRQFCFSLITPRKQWVLQATSESMKQGWLTAINEGIERALNSGTGAACSDHMRSGSSGSADGRARSGKIVTCELTLRARTHTHTYSGHLPTHSPSPPQQAKDQQDPEARKQTVAAQARQCLGKAP